MKKYLIISPVFLLFGCTPPTQQITVNTEVTAINKEAQNIYSLDPAAFKALAETQNYTIIDIRTEKELQPENGGKIFETALNIDYYKPDFKMRLSKLNKTDKFLIYCASGNRSKKALEVFKTLGFSEVADLAGGKNAWEIAGLN